MIRCSNCSWSNPDYFSRCQKCDSLIDTSQNSSEILANTIESDVSSNDPWQDTLAGIYTIASSDQGFNETIQPQKALEKTMASDGSSEKSISFIKNFSISADRPSVRPGEFVSHYKIEEILGEGTFAKVFRVEDDLTNEKFAMKVLKLGSSLPRARNKIIKRFDREFRIGHIGSHYILRSLDRGEINGNPFLIQELAENGSLYEYMKPQISFQFINRVAIDTLSGLEILHEKGIIHRDIKPDNIFSTKDEFKLGDFGISGVINSRITEVNTLGHAKEIFGSYAYIAPEQANSTKSLGSLSAAADIWSFGVTIFELITGGKYPFGNLTNDADLANYLNNAANGLHRTISYYRKDTPNWWEEIIISCLELDHKKRISSARKIREKIEKKMSNHSNIDDFSNLRYEYDIFLSFASEDMEFAEKVYKAMTNRGYKVFFASETLLQSVGKSFFQLIEEALEKCQHFVLICSQIGLRKEWVKAEYETFFNECHVNSPSNRRLIPLIHPEHPKVRLPFLLRRFQLARTPEQVIKNIKPEILGTIWKDK